MTTDINIKESNSGFISFNSKIQETLKFFDEPELARRRLRFYRWKNTEELDKNLLEFENGVKRTGGNVLWGYEHADCIEVIKNLNENKQSSAFIKSRISDELEIEKHTNITPLQEVKKGKKAKHLDFLIAPAKFIVSASGHIFYCTEDENELDAVSNAKNILFTAGIESVVGTGYELELAKNLYSTYELGKFGYSIELILKPGKPDSRFMQHIYILLIDNGRSNLLENSLDRSFFPLLNFDLPQEVSSLFIKDSDENVGLFELLTGSRAFNNTKSKKNYFSNTGYNRLSGFLPFNIDIHTFFMKSRLEQVSSKKSSLINNMFKTNYLKYFLKSKEKLTPQKFSQYLKEYALDKSYKFNSIPEKSFIEQYYYNKRKV